jgi:hypothetical protein
VTTPYRSTPSICPTHGVAGLGTVIVTLLLKAPKDSTFSSSMRHWKL